MPDTVISLCDITGHMTRPWVEAGYRAILIDPQHGLAGDMTDDGTTRRWAMTIDEALPHLATVFATETIAATFAFPPCTHLAGSGARWFAEKYHVDHLFQVRALFVAEQCRVVGQLSGAPWMVENPKGVLSRLFGPATHNFDPYQYTQLEPADNYTKSTNLWTGGGFVMPPPQQDLTLGPPDDRIHKAPPSAERANFRSMTPMGFARAVFAANAA